MLRGNKHFLVKLFHKIPSSFLVIASFISMLIGFVGPIMLVLEESFWFIIASDWHHFRDIMPNQNQYFYMQKDIFQ